MKLFKKNIGAAATLILAAVLIFTTSCTKDNDNPIGAEAPKAEVKPITDKGLQSEIRAAVDRNPPIAWYNKTMDKVIVYNPLDNSKSFSFSDPAEGWTFATNQGIVWTQNPAGGGVMFITPGAFGTGSGGVVTAGNLTLPISFAFCFTADEGAMGVDPGDFGDFSGLSGVIGIAGNLDALENEDFGEEGVEIEAYFLGVAVYLVFADQASGSYPVLNYVNDGVDLNEIEDDLVQEKSFSLVFGFDPNSAGLYMSMNGNMDVSGGNMTFSGSYYGFEFNFNSIDLDDEAEDPELDFLEGSYVEVSGSGTMGC